MIDGIRGHSVVDVVCSRESRIVEEAQGNEDCGREFAVRERDIQVLICCCI